VGQGLVAGSGDQGGALTHGVGDQGEAGMVGPPAGYGSSGLQIRDGAADH
jgi:hypothetical protein